MERREAEEGERRRQAAEDAQERAAEADQAHARSWRDIAMRRAGTAGLDGASAVKLANSVEARRQVHVGAGLPAKAFDGYRVIQDELAQLGYGVRVPSTNPLDAARILPPPRGEEQPAPPGAVSADETAEREERALRAQERARRLQEQNRRDREAYLEALARHGLLDPANGYPTGPGTSGFGL